MLSPYTSRQHRTLSATIATPCPTFISLSLTMSVSLLSIMCTIAHVAAHRFLIFLSKILKFSSLSTIEHLSSLPNCVFVVQQMKCTLNFGNLSLFLQIQQQFSTIINNHSVCSQYSHSVHPFMHQFSHGALPALTTMSSHNELLRRSQIWWRY